MYSVSKPREEWNEVSAETEPSERRSQAKDRRVGFGVQRHSLGRRRHTPPHFEVIMLMPSTVSRGVKRKYSSLSTVRVLNVSAVRALYDVFAGR